MKANALYFPFINSAGKATGKERVPKVHFEPPQKGNGIRTGLRGQFAENLEITKPLSLLARPAGLEPVTF